MTVFDPTDIQLRVSEGAKRLLFLIADRFGHQDARWLQQMYGAGKPPFREAMKELYDASAVESGSGTTEVQITYAGWTLLFPDRVPADPRREWAKQRGKPMDWRDLVNEAARGPFEHDTNAFEGVRERYQALQEARQELVWQRMIDQAEARKQILEQEKKQVAEFFQGNMLPRGWHLGADRDKRQSNMAIFPPFKNGPVEAYLRVRPDGANGMLVQASTSLDGPVERIDKSMGVNGTQAVLFWLLCPALDPSVGPLLTTENARSNEQ